MGSIDIANAKHTGDRSFGETVNDALFSALVMAGHFKNRMMHPFRGEGATMPWRQRVAALVGRTIINPVDVAVGDRHPGTPVGNWLTVRGKASSIGSQLLASVGAIADGGLGRQSAAPAPSEDQAVTTDSDLPFEVPLGSYSELGTSLDVLRKGGNAMGAINE